MIRRPPRSTLFPYRRSSDLMLDGLKTSLSDAIKKIVKSSGIDEELIKDLSKDVQRALLQSDVNVRLVLEITKHQIGKHTSELQSHHDLVCRLLLEKKKKTKKKPKKNNMIKKI